MLDPISALSVASSLVQFVDFSAKILSKGHRLFHSTNGSLLENDEIETVAKRLRDMIQDLQGSLSSTGNKEQALANLCKEFIEVAEELILELKMLKLPSDSRYRRWKSLRQALKSVWSRDKLESMENRLRELDGHLKIHILILLRYLIIPF
jgi:hypothetical protein